MTEAWIHENVGLAAVRQALAVRGSHVAPDVIAEKAAAAKAVEAPVDDVMAKAKAREEHLKSKLKDAKKRLAQSDVTGSIFERAQKKRRQKGADSDSEDCMAPEALNNPNLMAAREEQTEAETQAAGAGDAQVPVDMGAALMRRRFKQLRLIGRRVAE